MTSGPAHGHDSRPACAHCGAVIDPLRDPARVVAGRLVGVCRPCAEGTPALRPAPAAPVTPPEPAPVRDPGSDEPFLAGPDRVRGPGTWRVYSIGLGAAACLAMAATYAGSTSPAPAALPGAPMASSRFAGSPEPHASGSTPARGSLRAQPASPEDEDDLDEEGISELAPESVPPTLEDMWEDTGEPLEERLPTLEDWVFPVLRSDETFPLRASRRFGAKRVGKRVARCGQGHCGVDLEGTKGTPVVAVAFGAVVRIERGNKKRSGRYVRIEHPDYVYTSYMHLDTIARGLEVGDEVEPGTVIGTIGRTGIKESAPHLHFSLEVPIEGKLVHIDPARFLERATHIDDPSEAYEAPADE